jgi:colanic acid/amylovoran biosynthesis glycosyltransferase
MTSSGANILIYTEPFLNRSMTFVYNQLRQAAGEFTAYAGCTKRVNDDYFPYDKVIVFPEHRGPAYYIQGALRQSGLLYVYRNGAFERSLVRFIRTNGIALVHAHFGLSAIRVFRAVRKCNIPLLVTFHGFDASRYLRNSGYVRTLASVMQSPGVHGIAVSKRMKEQLQAVGIDTSRTIHHYIGTDTDFFDPSRITERPDPRSFTFLQVSNFVEKKGHAYTVNAFHKFLKETDTSQRRPRLVLAGEGPLKRKIERLTQKLGIDGYVEFPGFCDTDGVRRLMALADCFVHHSVTASNGDQEGIPTVIMEAMAMNLPVLSTYHSGIPELVVDRLHGLLVGERDVDACSRAMQIFYRNEPPQCTGMRERVIESFNLGKNSALLCRHYTDIMERYEPGTND